MNFFKCDIEGLLLFVPDVYTDLRGQFFESYNRRKYNLLVPELPKFVQTNISKSRYGVIRGLHFQKEPYAQDKLVSVLKGKVLDVAVDLRLDSPTFGKYYSVELTDKNNYQLFIPKGFAHGFSALSQEVIFEYKCSDFFTPDSEVGILWNDPDIAIDWKLEHKDVIVSQKDSNNITFAEFKKLVV